LIRHPPQPFALLALSGLSNGMALTARWAHARGDDRIAVEPTVKLPIFVLIMSNVAVVPQLLTVISAGQRKFSARGWVGR